MSLDREARDQLTWLRDLRKNRPELDSTIHGLCARLGVSSIAEMARTHPDEFDALFDAMWDLEEEVGDGDPSQPNLTW